MPRMNPADPALPAEPPPPPSSQRASQWIALFLGLVPAPLLLFAGGTSWKWLALGGLSWILGVLVKIPLTGGAYIVLSSAPAATRAAVSGILSGACELGTAALLFRLGPPAGSVLVNALAFGTAAGCTELLVVLGAGLFAKPSTDTVERWVTGARTSACVRYTFLLERGNALAGHIGSRGLLSLSLYGGPPALAGIALLGFALTDGLAAYGGLKEWDWFAPAICRRFHGLCAATSLVECTAFAIFGLLLF